MMSIPPLTEVSPRTISPQTGSPDFARRVREDFPILRQKIHAVRSSLSA